MASFARRGPTAPPHRRGTAAGASGASSTAAALRLRAAATLTVALILPGLLLATTGGSGWAGAVSRSGLAARDRALVRVRVWTDGKRGGSGLPPPRRAGPGDWEEAEEAEAPRVAVDSSATRADPPPPRPPPRPPVSDAAAPPPAVAAAVPPSKPTATVLKVSPPLPPKPATPPPLGKQPAAAAAQARRPPTPPAKHTDAGLAAAFPGASLPTAAGSTPADGLPPLAARIAYAVAGSPRALGRTVPSDLAMGKAAAADGPAVASAAAFGPYPAAPLPPHPVAPAPRPLLLGRTPRLGDRVVKPREEGGEESQPPPTLRLTAAACAGPAALAAAAAAQLPPWALRAPGMEAYLSDACAALGPALAVTERGLATAGGAPRRTSAAAAWPWLEEKAAATSPPPHHAPASNPLQYFASVEDENRDGAAADLPPRSATVVVAASTAACFGGPPLFARARPCGCTGTILLPALDAARHFGVLGADPAAMAAFKAADETPFARRAPGAVWRGAPDASPAAAALLAAHGPGVAGADARLDVAAVTGSVADAPSTTPTKPPLPLKTALGRRVVLALADGDGDASLAWALASRSALAMPPPALCSGLMEDLLVPWTHYIPLDAASPGANATAAVDWCEANMAACEAIGAAGAAWVTAWGLGEMGEVGISEAVARVAFADGRV